MTLLFSCTCLQPVVPAAASIPAVASVPGGVAAHNIPAGSAVGIDSAVFAGVGVPWVPADVMVSAVDGVPAVTRVSAVVTVPAAVYVLSRYWCF